MDLATAASEVPALHVRMAPQCHLEQAGLHPRRVHLLHLLGGVPLPGEEGLEREGDGEHQGREVAERYNVGRGGGIGSVLLRSTMA
jgi:hypothetical protein